MSQAAMTIIASLASVVAIGIGAAIFFYVKMHDKSSKR